MGLVVSFPGLWRARRRVPRDPEFMEPENVVRYVPRDYSQDVKDRRFLRSFHQKDWKLVDEFFSDPAKMQEMERMTDKQFLLYMQQQNPACIVRARKQQKGETYYV